MITNIYTDDYVYIRSQDHLGRLFIHAEILKKNKNTVNHCMEVWSGITKSLKESGVDKVYCYIQEHNNKLREFAAFYGFDLEEEHDDYEIWSMEI